MLDMVVATTRSPVNMPRAFRSRAAISRMASPLITLPCGPANMQRSASPSKVTPRSAPRAVTSCGDVLRMQRPAVGVNVAAVGRDVEQGDVAASLAVEALEELRRNGRSGAVGAIGNDLQMGERKAGNAVDEELDVIGLERRIVLDGWKALRIGDLRPARRGGRISSSMASSTASGSLKPSAPKSLMPLSCQGLCEAEMTTPAWKPCVRARNATAGVVTMPALSTSCACFAQACGQRGRDPRAGLARVAAEKHFGLLLTVLRSECASASPTL